jgi:NADP-dependent 3-hydroxy acid dehydrogenase YdfG
MTSTSDLAGERVLVTGGSRGIGAAIVRRRDRTSAIQVGQAIGMLIEAGP